MSGPVANQADVDFVLCAGFEKLVGVVLVHGYDRRRRPLVTCPDCSRHLAAARWRGGYQIRRHMRAVPIG